MKKGVYISPVWLVCFIICILALLAAYHIPAREKQNALRRLATAKSQQKSGNEAIQTLKEFDQASLSKARARAEQFRSTLLTTEAETELLKGTGTQWRVSEGSAPDSNVEYVRRSLTLSQTQVDVGDWPIILKSIQALAKQPGMRFRSISIQSVPDEAHPVFTRIELRVDVFTRAGEKTAG